MAKYQILSHRNELQHDVLESEDGSAFFWIAEFSRREHADLFVAALTAKDEECSRHPEPAADPQETADGGEGIDIPTPVRSPTVAEVRAYESGIFTPIRGYEPSGTPSETVPKTVSENPSPSRTLGTESDPSHNGTQERDAQAALDRIAEIIEYVDHRAQFGANVSPTLQVMEQSEISAIYALSKGKPEGWTPGDDH